MNYGFHMYTAQYNQWHHQTGNRQISNAIKLLYTSARFIPTTML